MKLTINNSECQITDISKEQFSELRSILNYRVDNQAVFYSKSFGTPVRYLIDKKGNFPTGLLYLVEEWIQAKRLIVEVLDQRVIPDTLLDAHIASINQKPYPEQVEAAKAAKKWHRGVICAPTGVGKSMIAALIINELQVNTLIVVPTLELKNQLTSTLKKVFSEDKVGGIGKPIYVENIQSLDPKKKMVGYGCVIIDEFHHSAADSYRELNKKAWNTIYYKIGLTATPFRSQDNERLLLESVLSRVIYRIEYKKAIENKYITPIEAYYVEIPKKKDNGEYKNYQAAYKYFITENDIRNGIISSILNNLIESKHSSLCLVKEITHGDSLVQSVGNRCHFVKGENDDNREKILEFILGEQTCLIGTMGVLGEGVDTKPCEFVLIASPVKSKNQFMQSVGRAFRNSAGKESGKVILFKDTSHKWFHSAFKQQKKILLEEYGIVPSEIKVLA